MLKIQNLPDFSTLRRWAPGSSPVAVRGSVLGFPFDDHLQGEVVLDEIPAEIGAVPKPADREAVVGLAKCQR